MFTDLTGFNTINQKLHYKKIVNNNQIANRSNISQNDDFTKHNTKQKKNESYFNFHKL